LEEPRKSGSQSKGRVELPLSEAFRVSLEQIRRRMKRSGIVVLSITLGIALMAHFLVVSFLVCVVGLTNASLIAVYERYREIGIMKSLGALDRHILEMFLIECTIFGLIGGTLGFAAGSISASFATSAQIGFGALSNVRIPDLLLNLGYSVGLAVLLNVVSTIYPAYKAAKLKPVEALAYEI